MSAPNTLAEWAMKKKPDRKYLCELARGKVPDESAIIVATCGECQHIKDLAPDMPSYSGEVLTFRRACAYFKSGRK